MGVLKLEKEVRLVWVEMNNYWVELMVIQVGNLEVFVLVCVFWEGCLEEEVFVVQSFFFMRELIFDL